MTTSRGTETCIIRCRCTQGKLNEQRERRQRGTFALSTLQWATRLRNLRESQRGNTPLMPSNTLQQLWEHRVLRRPCQSPSLPQWHNGRCVTRCSGREESSSSTPTLTRREPSDERKPLRRALLLPRGSCVFLWARPMDQAGASFQRVPFLQTTMTTESSPRVSSPQLSSRPQGGIQ